MLAAKKCNVQIAGYLPRFVSGPTLLGYGHRAHESAPSTLESLALLTCKVSLRVQMTTSRISEPAPVVLDLESRCNRGFHCIRLLGLMISLTCTSSCMVRGCMLFYNYPSLLFPRRGLRGIISKWMAIPIRMGNQRRQGN